MTAYFDKGCILPDGCPDDTKCRHRCLEAVKNPIPSGDGSFTKAMLSDVPLAVLEPQEIDFKAWNDLSTVSKNRPIGFTKGED